MEFCPDYRNVEKAARNIRPDRLPIYEHLICYETMAELLGRHFYSDDLDEYYSDYCEFFRKNGYDTVTFEACITSVMPGNGCLGAHRESTIKTMDDLLKYPFDEIPEYFFKAYSPHFEALSNWVTTTTVILSERSESKDPSPKNSVKRTDCDSLRAAFGGCSLARACGRSLRLRRTLCGFAQNDMVGGDRKINPNLEHCGIKYPGS